MHHQPVLLEEVVRMLALKKDAFYVDATLGAGGHALALLQALSGQASLFGIDQDPAALEIARANLAGYDVNTKLDNFEHLASCFTEFSLPPAQGILLDLGVSSMQLDWAERGFSFMKEAPLDMRMSSQGMTAAELIQSLEEQELARILRHYGEEPFARPIARKLKSVSMVETTGQLSALVEASLPAAERRRRKIHPATLTFQALRIAVNNELAALENFLQQGPALLAKGGRLAIISYHSLEDRMVKRAFAALANPCTCPPGLPICLCGQKAAYRLLGKKAIKPTPVEIDFNPRARSAKLRVLEAIAEA